MLFDPSHELFGSKHGSFDRLINQLRLAPTLTSGHTSTQSMYLHLIGFIDDGLLSISCGLRMPGRPLKVGVSPSFPETLK